MNTNIPESISCETRVRSAEGSEVHLTDSVYGDSLNLTTGQARVARLIGGVRYDTAQASIIIGVGEYFGGATYALHRLYRTNEGRFFQLGMCWARVKGLTGAIAAIEETQVLVFAKNVLPSNEVGTFLRNWYCSGLLPRDDAFVQEWAEALLSADECQAVLVALGNRYSPRADDSVPTGT